MQSVPLPFRRPRRFLRKHRHKGGGESAFGKQAAKQVRQLESNKECVGNHARAQKICQDHIPRKTSYPANKRKTSESRDGFE